MSKQTGTAKSSLEDLRKSALEEYDRASSAVHCWSSFIDRAIRAYVPEGYPAPNSEGEKVAGDAMTLPDDVGFCIQDIINEHVFAMRGDNTDIEGVNRAASKICEWLQENLPQAAPNSAEIEKIAADAFDAGAWHNQWGWRSERKSKPPNKAEYLASLSSPTQK